MRARTIFLAALMLLVACSSTPTAPAAPPERAALQSQYVGPGSGGDQHP